MNQNEFVEAVKALGIEVTDTKLNQLEKYYEMLIEYNKVMNLTGITKREDVYLKHFYDSLTIFKIIDLTKEESLCDIGTGAGFPGIVLKIFFPHLKVVLVDSLNKRINFLLEVIKKLNLKDIIAVHSRIEDYASQNREKFDVITARAVAQLNVLIELAIPLAKINKYFISMKGNIENELDYTNALKTISAEQVKIIKFELPKENSNRSLIKIQKKSVTQKIFPRKYSDIKKKPL